MNDCAAFHHDEPRPAEPGAHLCPPCKAGLRSDLRRLPLLDRNLEGLLDPRRSGACGHGDGTGLPYHEPAAECRSQIDHDLRVWVWRILDEREPSSCPVLTLPAMAGWLSGWVTWASRRTWAGEMAAAFADDRSRAVALLDPRPRADIPIPADCNHCPRCGHDGCLWATVYQAADDRRPSVVTCWNCEHEWAAVEWLRLGKTILAWRDAQAKEAA
jgi:hypothetical protein